MAPPYAYLSLFNLLFEFVDKPPLPTLDVNPSNSTQYDFLISLDLLKISDNCIVITSRGMETIFMLENITGRIIDDIREKTS